MRVSGRRILGVAARAWPGGRAGGHRRRRSRARAAAGKRGELRAHAESRSAARARCSPPGSRHRLGHRPRTGPARPRRNPSGACSWMALTCGAPTRCAAQMLRGIGGREVRDRALLAATAARAVVLAGYDPGARVPGGGARHGRASEDRSPSKIVYRRPVLPASMIIRGAVSRSSCRGRDQRFHCRPGRRGYARPGCRDGLGADPLPGESAGQSHLGRRRWPARTGFMIGSVVCWCWSRRVS